jgi:hypothetical protein
MERYKLIIERKGFAEAPNTGHGNKEEKSNKTSYLSAIAFTHSHAGIFSVPSSDDFTPKKRGKLRECFNGSDRLVLQFFVFLLSL